MTKTITLEIDERYAQLLSLTLIGTVGEVVSVTVKAIDIRNIDKIKVDEDGLITKEGK